MSQDTIRILVALNLFCGGCGTSSGSLPVRNDNEEERERAVTKENERRQYWKDQIVPVQLTWDRKELNRFMCRIRTDRSDGYYYPIEARIRFDNGPELNYSLYILDETWNVFATWKGEEAESLAAVEVVGFPDLRATVSPQMFDILTAIQRVPPTIMASNFDGVSIIRAVNALQRLGRHGAIGAVKQYIDLCKDTSYVDSAKYRLSENRLVPLVQLLLKDHSLIKEFSFSNDLDAAKLREGSSWPLFPITVEDDFPFSVVNAGGTLNTVEDVLAQLKEGRAALRAQPLSPKLNPAEAAEGLLASDRWKELRLSPDQQAPKRAQIRRQAIQALAPILSLSPDDLLWLPFGPPETRWAEILEKTRKSQIRWDESKQEFVRTR